MKQKWLTKLCGLRFNPIRVYAKGEIPGNTIPGRVYFNELLPKDYPYDNNPQTKKQINKVLADSLRFMAQK